MGAPPCPLWVKSRHVHHGMSALPPKADMCSATRDVRFVPEADILTICKLRYFTGNRSAIEVRNCQSDAPVGRSTL